MLNHRNGMRGIALIIWLAGSALLEAQVTPHIDSIASSLVTVNGETQRCLGATKGSAVTVNSPGIGGGICMYITGSFDAADGDSETVTWTDGTNGTVTLNSPVFPTATTVVAIVPANLLAVAETAAIQVNEAPPEIFVVRGNPALQLAGDPASNTATFTVNPVIQGIAHLPSGIVGVAYSQPFFTGGTAPFTVAFNPTNISGLVATTGTGNPLQGTPNSTGIFTIGGTLTDSWGNAIGLNGSVTFFNPLSILTTSLPPGRINTAYVPTTLAATNGNAPFNWSATGLPTGMTLNAATGVLSGTPTQSGNFTVNVTLTDRSPQVANASLALTIVPTLVITTTTL